MRDLKIRASEMFLFFPSFFLTPLSPPPLPSLVIYFGGNDKLITNNGPKRGLGTPKSHTRKKRLLYTADFRVIYTSYLFPETTNALRSVAPRASPMTYDR